MSLKEAVAYDPGDRYTPFGGAKGGIDCDPYDPDARGVLRRYVEAMRPFLERHWATGEDFGLRQDTIDEVFAEAGLRSSIEAALLRLDDPDAGLRAAPRGVRGRRRRDRAGEVVGGYGVAEAALAALERLGLAPATTRAVVQGFGSMGGATARYLARAGVRVVGIADRDGLIANPRRARRRAAAERPRRPRRDRPRRAAPRRRAAAGRRLARARRRAARARRDVLRDRAEEAERVSARVIVEAANVATLPEAERRLAERGIVVVPDFVANLATNAWWWWTLFGDVPPEREPRSRRSRRRCAGSWGSCSSAPSAGGILPREAATAMAGENLDRLAARAASPEPQVRRSASIARSSRRCRAANASSAAETRASSAPGSPARRRRRRAAGLAEPALLPRRVRDAVGEQQQRVAGRQRDRRVVGRRRRRRRAPSSRPGAPTCAPARPPA